MELHEFAVTDEPLTETSILVQGISQWEPVTVNMLLLRLTAAPDIDLIPETVKEIIDPKVPSPDPAPTPTTLTQVTQNTQGRTKD